MRWLCFTALVVSGTALAAPVPNKTSRDAKELPGVWAAERWGQDGVMGSKNDYRFAPRVEVAETSLAIQRGPLSYPMRYTLDASKTPAHIDMVYAGGPNKGKTVKGIYELKGDTLKLCVAPPGQDRPAALESKKGEPWELFELTRKKSEE
jgi:uncharacterized protein (TIGR03067 family)